MTIEQPKELTIEDLKQLIVGVQKDAEQANMPAAKHQMRMQLVQLRLQQLDSYTLVNTKEYEQHQKDVKEYQVWKNCKSLKGIDEQELKNKIREAEIELQKAAE